VAVPKNFAGYQEPYDGDGYAGFGFDPPGYFEYLQTQLRSRLHKDSVYHVAFRVSRADNSPSASPGLGAYFSNRSLSTTGSPYASFQVLPQLRIDTAVTDTAGWVLIEGDFTAQGDERFLIIGCFPIGLQIGQPSPTSEKNGISHTYYYVDDVHVTPARPVAIPASTVGPSVPVTWIVADILFDTDESELKPEGQRYLDSLRTTALEQALGTIRIDGHTDNTGTASHNDALSLRRAEVVANHLASAGIARSRLVTQGLGSTLPIADNSTPQARSSNRRVAITLLP
jgi:OOP family OmpA-OmpF porin